MPKEEENRENLSWIAMLASSSSIFCALLAWRLVEPLAKDFLFIFFMISVLLGYLFRQSAISPYKLAEFWSKGNPFRKDKK
jgi:hypothetical protein